MIRPRRVETDVKRPAPALDNAGQKVDSRVAEFERAPDKMVAARLTQLRLAGASLGLDPTTRPRLVGTPPPATDPADRFLGAQHTHLR
jgi:hypothetical protein